MVGAFNTPTAAPACSDCDGDGEDTPDTVETLRQELREIKSALGGVLSAKQELTAHHSSVGSRLNTPSTGRLGAVREDEIAVVPETPSAVPLAQPLQVPSARLSALDLMWQSLEKAAGKLRAPVTANAKKSGSDESALELMAKSVVKNEADARKRDQIKTVADQGRLSFARSALATAMSMVSAIGGGYALALVLALKISAPLLARLLAKLTLAVSDWSWVTMCASSAPFACCLIW
jgi:hypothetical protein